MPRTNAGYMIQCSATHPHSNDGGPIGGEEIAGRDIAALSQHLFYGPPQLTPLWSRPTGIHKWISRDR